MKDLVLLMQVQRNYVVDGFPYGGEISDINTDDVESITLLN
jgi:hypothetical protein